MTNDEAIQWLESNYDSSMQIYVYDPNAGDGLKYIRAVAGDYIGGSCYARPMFEIKQQA